MAILAIAVLVVAVTGTSFAAWTVRRSFPQTSGEITLPGLTGTVDVLRDDRGIPHLYADTSQDLFYAQGYVHAQDRFFEMDFRRHITSGRLSEMFGKTQVDTDKFLRVSGWRAVAEQEYALLSSDTRRNLDSYTKGVNAYLADHSGATASLEYAILGLTNSSYVIEPWGPVDSIAWLKAMAWDLRGNMQEEIARAIISAKVGVARTSTLYPAFPYATHRPIVEQGAVRNGVWDQSASATSTQAASKVPATPALSLGALERASKALTSLDPLLGPSGPGIGSNSWVISGSKTETGKPLLANDPHLAPAMPSIWYQMGLHCRVVSPACPYDVAGYTFSGVPGVVIGHNNTIGWGFTNLGPDVSDLYLEKVVGDTYVVDGHSKQLTSRTEIIKVAGGEPVTIVVRASEHGPLISDAGSDFAEVGKDAPVAPGAPPRGAGYAVALRWTALTPGRTMDSLTELNVAQTWEQFRSAAAKFEVPAQNMIFASTDGTIGYQTPGVIPIRSGYDGKYPAQGWDSRQSWTGNIAFAALPNVKNPDDGWIVTANQASVYPDYPYFITDDWSYGARSQRVVERVQAATSNGNKMTVAEMQAIQFDSWNENAAFLAPLIRHTAGTGSASQAVALFDGWDYTQPSDSAAAAYFNSFWRHLLLDTFGSQLPSDYQPDGGDRWFTIARNLWSTPSDKWWDNTGTVAVESRDTSVSIALQEAADELTKLQGSNPVGWRWGDLHTLLIANQTLGQSGIAPIEAIFNRGPVTTSGGDSIVNATGWTVYKGYEVDWVPSMRMVLDLSNLDQSTWVNLTGNSGHAYNRNYVDQLDSWQVGASYSFAFSLPAVQAASTARLTLKPA